MLAFVTLSCASHLHAAGGGTGQRHSDANVARISHGAPDESASTDDVAEPIPEPTGGLAAGAAKRAGPTLMTPLRIRIEQVQRPQSSDVRLAAVATPLTGFLLRPAGEPPR